MKDATIIIHNSPWQLVNSIEIISHYKIKDAELLIFCRKNSVAQSQLEALVKFEELTATFFPYGNGFLSKVKRYLQVIKIKAKSSNVFFAQLDVRWLNFFLKRCLKHSFFLFDEGTHTLQFLDGSRQSVVPLKEVFTTYSDVKNSSKPKLTKNSMKVLKSKLTDLDVVEETWFIGQPLYKDDLSMKNHLIYLKKVISKFPGCKYVPHRHESKHFLSEVKQLGYEFIENKICLEYIPITTGYLPKKLLGFTSSSLMAFKDLELGIQIEFVRVDEKVCFRPKKIAEIYKMMEVKISEASIE